MCKFVYWNIIKENTVWVSWRKKKSIPSVVKLINEMV